MSQALNEHQAIDSTTWSKRVSDGWGNYLPPGKNCIDEKALLEKCGFRSMGEWLSTGILVIALSALSLEPQNPDFPHATLVHFALPLLEPKVSRWNKI